MRTALIAAVLTLAATPVFAADPVEGEWLTEAGTAKVKIGPCAEQPDRMCGLVSWMKTPRNDIHNPDAALRDKPILGMALIRDFKASAPGKWTGGKIYDPESGKTYDSKLTARADGTLKVEGCIAIICKAQTWKR